MLPAAVTPSEPAPTACLVLVPPESARRGDVTVKVGPRGYALLAVMLRRCDWPIDVLRVKVWHNPQESHQSVRQTAWRLNRKLAQLGESRRVQLDAGRVLFL